MLNFTIQQTIRLNFLRVSNCSQQPQQSQSNRGRLFSSNEKGVFTRRHYTPPQKILERVEKTVENPSVQYPCEQEKVKGRRKFMESRKEAFLSSLHSVYRPLSFYKFFRLSTDADIIELCTLLRREFNRLEILGRIFVGRNGINAQMIVPQRHFDAFEALFTKENSRLAPLFDILREQSLSTEIFLNVEHEPFHVNFDQLRSETFEKHARMSIPFRKLTVRKKHSILRSPMDKHDLSCSPTAFETNNGEYLEPEQWHHTLKQFNASKMTLLDCRNWYESEVGYFKNAQCIPSDTFHDSLPMISDTIEHKPNSDILVYCTGGIRCEVVARYLVQEKGIPSHRVKKLKGGINAYARFLNKTTDEPSQFLGNNFVFDDRLDVKITDDVLSKCHTCGTPSNTHINCANLACHALVLQCAQCTDAYKQTCSEHCYKVLKLPQKAFDAYRRKIGKIRHQPEQSNSNTQKKSSFPQQKSSFSQQKSSFPQQKSYSKSPFPQQKSSFSSSSNTSLSTLPTSLTKLGMVKHFSTSSDSSKHRSLPTWALDRTHDVITYAQKHSSPSLISPLSDRIARVTEHQFSNLTQMLSAPVVTSLLQFLVATRQCKRILEVGSFTGFTTATLATNFLDTHEPKALVALEKNPVYIECMQHQFQKESAYHRLIEEGIIDVVEGEAIDFLEAYQGEPFDLVYLDANKAQYAAYYDALIEHNVLNPQGGLIVIDNTLYAQRMHEKLSNKNKLHKYIPKRISRLIEVIDAFNEKVVNDPRTLNLMLPMADGITLCQRIDQ